MSGEISNWLIVCELKCLQVQSFNINDPSTLISRLESDFIYSMHDPRLLFARDIHHIEREELDRKSVV